MSQQRVMTEFGPGVIVASEKVRGTTSYKIEGPGFSIWREAQQIPEFGQLQRHGRCGALPDRIAQDDRRRAHLCVGRWRHGG